MNLCTSTGLLQMHTHADYVMVITDAIQPDLVTGFLNEPAHFNIWLSYTDSKMGEGEVIPVSEPSDELPLGVAAIIQRYQHRSYDLNDGKNFLMMGRAIGFRLLRYSKGRSM